MSGKTYDWYPVHTLDNCLTTSATPPANMRQIDVRDGVQFTNGNSGVGYAFDVVDGYDITRHIISRNVTTNIPDDFTPMTIEFMNQSSSESKQVQIAVENPHDDLIIGFTGPGSIDATTPITLAPGQAGSQTLRVFSQETQTNHYMLTLTITDLTTGAMTQAPLEINIERPSLSDISITYPTGTDLINLIEAELDLDETAAIVFINDMEAYREIPFSVQNNNASVGITNLSVDLIDSNGVPITDWIIEPDLTHVYLPPGGSIFARFIPLELGDSGSSSSSMMVTGDSPRRRFGDGGQSRWTYAFEGMQQTGSPDINIQLSNDGTQDTRTMSAAEEPESGWDASCGDTTPQLALCSYDQTTFTSGGSYCTNNPNIQFDLPVWLPPDATINGAFYSVDFAGGSDFPYKHEATVGFNGVQGETHIVPDDGTYTRDLGRNEMDAIETGTMAVTVRSRHQNGGHYQVATNASLTLDLDGYRRPRCLPPGEIPPTCTLTTPDEVSELLSSGEDDCTSGCGGHNPGGSGVRSTTQPIELRSGNYEYAQSDISLDAHGYTLLFRRNYATIYGTLDWISTDPVGGYWRHNQDMRLEFDTASSGYFIDASGAAVRFTEDVVTPGTYHFENGYLATIAQISNDHWRVTFEDNGELDFWQPTGKSYALIRTRVAPDNTVPIIYTYAQQSDGEYYVVDIAIEPSPTQSPIPITGTTDVITSDGVPGLDFTYSNTLTSGGEVLLESVTYRHIPDDPAIKFEYTDAYGSIDNLGPRLDAVTDQRSGKWTYEYTGLELPQPTVYLTVVRDPLGNILERQTFYTLVDLSANNNLTEDVLGRVKTQFDGEDNIIVDLQYTGNETIVTDGNGTVMVYTHEEWGSLQRAAIVDPTTNTELPLQRYDYTHPQYRSNNLTDANGNIAAMDWSGDGEQLNSITDPLNNTTQFCYLDGENVPTRIIDPRQLNEAGTHSCADTSPEATDDITVIAYDDTDFPTRPTSITDATGQPTTFSYTDDGRVETVTATDGIVTTIEYDASGQVKRTVSSDSGGDLDNETRFAYDVQGRLTLSCEIRSTERCQHMEYDPAGNVIRTIQNVTDMDTGTPEIDGDFSNITRADSTTTQNLITEMTYDIAGNLIWISDVEGRVTLMAYDGDNRLIRVVRNCATDTTSEPVAWCTNTTDPFTITHANRLVLGEAGYAMVSDLNITTDYTYDAVDNLTGVTNTLGRVDYTCYDIQNRPVRTVQNAVTLTYEQACAEQAPAPASTDADIITAYLYDNVGNLLITTYPSTNEGTRYDFVCYDALNRPIRTIQNATTTSETLTDDYATACTAVVTPYNQGVTVSSDIINETTYDANGNVVETIDPFGVKTRYLYDDLNRPYAVVANYVDNLTEPTTENITSIG
ncbi:MAG: DUF6531 domain-containing protein [Chloroflexota bacterium]